MCWLAKAHQAAPGKPWRGEAVCIGVEYCFFACFTPMLPAPLFNGIGLIGAKKAYRASDSSLGLAGRKMTAVNAEKGDVLRVQYDEGGRLSEGQDEKPVHKDA
jgi:hypothetical protein